MKSILLSIALLLPSIALAQPIHGTQDSYASRAEWPVTSAQSHWDDDTSSIAHTHLDLKFPRNAEIAGPFVVDFIITAFHVDGELTAQGESWIWDGDSRPRPTDWFWDATQSSTSPRLLGDPNGIKQWTGHFTIQPGTNVRHGDRALVGRVNTFLKNGTIMITSNTVPYWAVDDVSLPAKIGLPASSSATDIATPNTTADFGYGSSIIEVRSVIPHKPFSTVQPLIVSSYGYQQRGLPPAELRMIVDPDYHNGDFGRTIFSMSQPDGGGPDRSITLNLDPAQIGSGAHKIVLMRFQPNHDGTEEQDTLLVFNVLVGDDVIIVPPPPPPPPSGSKNCSGTVAGTLTNSTLTLTGGSIICSE
jgi:hypothetical protein